MSQMPKEGAFLAVNTITNTANTYSWAMEENKLHKFEYLGAGKHKWVVVSQEEIDDLKNNPDVTFKPH